MAYQSWSVVFGEQPSASKWNILGTNMASFNDSTGINLQYANLVGLSNPYKFSAQATSSQTGVSSDVATTVTLGTENFDTNNNFASSTYTAPVAGFYQLDGTLSIGSSVTGAIDGYGASILKNGTTTVLRTTRFFDNNISADQAWANVSGLVQLAASDTIVLQGTIVVASGTGTFVSGDTKLTGFLVSKT